MTEVSEAFRRKMLDEMRAAAEVIQALEDALEAGDLEGSDDLLNALEEGCARWELAHLARLDQGLAECQVVPSRHSGAGVMQSDTRGER